MIIRSKLLERKKVNTELNQVVNYPLTIIVAAMGYGKTTAVWEYLNNSNKKYVWLSVEEEDSSAQFIWDALTEQLAKQIGPAGEKLHELGFPTDRAQRDKVIRTFEEEFYKSNSILVIDDYHFAQSSEIDYLLERIVKRHIEGLYILILSRTIPNFKVDELTLKGYCYNIKSKWFEVSEEEVAEYFEILGIDVNAATVNRIYSCSEGWVTAIVLAVRRYLDFGILEVNDSIYKLIETTVVSNYSPEELLILKQLCVLDYFSSAQANFVTGIESADKIIRKLSYENSFIRYNTKEKIFRIHNIFKNYLNELIENQAEKMLISEVYRKSGVWYSNNDRVLLGLKYFLKAKDYDSFLQEFEKPRITKVLDNSSEYIESLINQVPKEMKFNYPIAYLNFIGFYVTNIDGFKGSMLIDEAELYYKNQIDFKKVSKNRIFGEIELIKSYIVFNDADKMIDHMKSALELLKGKSLIANKEKIVTFGSPHIMYMYFKHSGAFKSDLEISEQLYEYYIVLADGCGLGFDYQIRAEYYLECGQWKEAEIFAHKSIYKAKTLNQVSVLICANLTLARLAIVRGEIDKASKIMDEFSDLVESCNSPILSSAFEMSNWYISLISNDCKGFTDYFKSNDMEDSKVLYQGTGYKYIIYGKYLVNQKAYINLELVCEEMLAVFKTFGNVLGYVHAYILDAISKQNLYGWQAAEKPFLLALEIGKKDELELIFYEYADHIFKLLEHAKDVFGCDDYFNKISEGSHKYSINLKKYKNHISNEINLTNREKEVLGHIVNGKTNREISKELFIAEVTVRKSITTIYRKLGVSGRVEAVKIGLKKILN